MSGVVILDAAMALEATGSNRDAAARLREKLAEGIAALGRSPGVARARYALDFSTHLAQSPGESVSRVQMHVLRFPKPELQFPVLDRNGTLWHSDFGWPAYRRLGEFDGFAKYTRGAYTQGKSIEEIVWAEKKREDLMRAVGYGMARWLWGDALRATLLTGILLEAGLPRDSRARTHSVRTHPPGIPGEPVQSE